MAQQVSVAGYAYGWNPLLKGGRVNLFLQDGSKRQFDINDINVFLTIATALNSGAAHFDPTVNLVFAFKHTGPLAQSPDSGENPFPW
jgi:hypothetical protein